MASGSLATWRVSTDAIAIAGGVVLLISAIKALAPIMRLVSLPVLQVIGWVFSALQAGLAVEVLIGSWRQMT